MLENCRLESCRDHVRRYLRAPFVADEARDNGEPVADLELVTAGVPPTLRRLLEEWAVDEATPDEEIAEFIDWPVGKVREHR